VGKHKFKPGDRVIANEKAPGDYQGRQATVVAHRPGKAEYAVNVDGHIAYLNSRWLDPVHEVPKREAEQRQLDLFGHEASLPKEAMMSEAQHFVALSKIRGVGVRTLRALYEKCGQFAKVWDLPKNDLISFATRLKLRDPALIADAIINDKQRLLNSASQDMEAFVHRNIHVLTIDDPEFPASLRQTPDPPYWLFVEGNANILSSNNLVAVVGTRRPTTFGLRLTRHVTTILAKHRFPVVSGLAEGIDATAHETALDFDAPCVAILGNGISIIFPRATSGIRLRIVQSNGAVVSEYLPYDSYQKARFVQRNRIQAAISRAVIPVEWNEHGGTAHTVRFAEKYGRLVILVGYKSREQEYQPRDARNNFTGKRHFIDLASPDAEIHLLDLIRSEKNGMTAPSLSPNKVSATPFAGLLREVGRLVEQYPVSEEDIEKLITEIRGLWLGRKDSHVD
jgi:DNA processing protein